MVGITESKGLSPGKPNPGHPVSLAFLPGSVCLGLQQKQGKENTSLAGDKPR